MDTFPSRLTDTPGLTDLQRDIVRTVREFTEREILPAAAELDRADTYPAEIVAGLRELGVFGLTIAPEYGGLGEPLLTYALVAEEISRGWMSISGIINTHFIVSYLIGRHGTPEQKSAFLPKMATGEIRAAFSMSEPELGSDVSAITTSGTRAGDDYVITGRKMWLTNGGTSSLVLLLARTDEGGAKPHQNLTAFLIEKEPGLGQARPGLTIPGQIRKMGYKGSSEYEIERLYRDAPMLLIGEGTAEIQKMIIGRRLLERYRLR